MPVTIDLRARNGRACNARHCQLQGAIRIELKIHKIGSASSKIVNSVMIVRSFCQQTRSLHDFLTFLRQLYWLTFFWCYRIFVRNVWNKVWKLVETKLFMLNVLFICFKLNSRFLRYKTFGLRKLMVHISRRSMLLHGFYFTKSFSMNRWSQKCTWHVARRCIFCHGSVQTHAYTDFRITLM